jgi:sRNA-binding protein
MTYYPTREESEAAIRTLANSYPKCFFENPRVRRPLKRNILADLEKDGAPVDPELLPHVIRWYESHFGYQYQIRAGAKRIDLNGKEVQAISETEQHGAESYIAKRKQENQERGQSHWAKGISFLTKSTTEMSTTPAKQLPITTPPKQSLVTTSSPVRTPEQSMTSEQSMSPIQVAPIQSALNAVSRIMVDPYSPDIRRALVVTALGVVVAEAQKLSSDLQNQAAG